MVNKKFFPLALSAFSFLCLTFSNCGRVALVRDQKEQLSQIAMKGGFCVSGDKQYYSKVIFVVDKSGSNATPSALRYTEGTEKQVASIPASDSDAKFRKSSLDRFVSATQQNPYVSYALITFQTTSSVVGSPDKILGRTINKQGQTVFVTGAEFKGASDQAFTDTDIGGTPYLGAISAAENLIKQDQLDSQGKIVFYNVFFLTDGLPSDGQPPGFVGSGPPTQTHFLAVKNLMAQAPQKISFSTVFYGRLDDAESDSTALKDAKQKMRDSVRAGLGKMAEYGNGLFVNLEANGQIDFTQLLAGPKKEPWLLRKFMVYNLNSGFCEDGTIGSDSDADGICDKDEEQFNSRFANRIHAISNHIFSPTQRNSLNENYSDFLVFKKSIASSETMPECPSGNKRNPYDLITNCEKNVLYSENPSGRNDTRTNQLKSIGGHGDNTTPDSDGDGFIDYVSLLTFRQLSAPLNFINVNNYYGAYPVSQIYEEHRHIKNLTESKGTYKINLKPEGYSDQLEYCYQFEQGSLPLYPTQEVNGSQSGFPELSHDTNENVVLIYYISAPERDPNGEQISYHYAYKKFKYEKDSSTIDVSTIQLNDSDFAVFDRPLDSTTAAKQ